MGTEIKNENEVVIDGQYIGQLNGLKLDLDLKSGSLKTDIKSLKKAARQAIAPELMRRTNKIVIKSSSGETNPNALSLFRKRDCSNFVLSGVPSAALRLSEDADIFF